MVACNSATRSAKCFSPSSRHAGSSSAAVPRQRSLKERVSSSQVSTVHVHLPESARILQTILEDNEKLLQFIGYFGGCTVRIPAQWPPHGKRPNFRGHPLRSVLSPAQMKRMVSHYGGTDFYVPKCSNHLKKLRNIALISSFSREVAAGKSTGQVVQRLARRYQLSDRRVWDILKDGADMVLIPSSSAFFDASMS